MDKTEIFQKQRERLMGLAYRLLGNFAEAEDAVQDTYVKWVEADQSTIKSASAWLTTVCARTCLDFLKSAKKSRTDYFGVWLPEPIHASDARSMEDELDLSNSLSIAFLLVMERLSPKERAAYILHEIFGMPYADLSELLRISEPACRKLVSRAKVNVTKSNRTHTPPKHVQDKFLDAFMRCVTTGAAEPLAEAFREDIRLQADGGGVVPTLEHVLSGKQDVLSFLVNQLSEYWRGCDWRLTSINRDPGFLLTRGDHIVASASFAHDKDGKISDIFIMRNPEKLQRFISSVREGHPSTLH